MFATLGARRLPTMLQYRPIQNILNSFVTFQVNYSQCLGVIGYSLIPLVLTAAALPLVHYFPMVSFSVKVINKNSLKQKIVVLPRLQLNL